MIAQEGNDVISKNSSIATKSSPKLFPRKDYFNKKFTKKEKDVCFICGKNSHFAKNCTNQKKLKILHQIYATTKIDLDKVIIISEKYERAITIADYLTHKQPVLP